MGGVGRVKVELDAVPAPARTPKERPLLDLAALYHLDYMTRAVPGNFGSRGMTLNATETGLAAAPAAPPVCRPPVTHHVISSHGFTSPAPSSSLWLQ
jgi:hypothetical protein